MKASLFVKVFLLLPLILFFDYLLMALLGCSTCLFGLGDNFYCGPFCLAGKIILALSVVFFGYIIYPDIKGFINYRKNVKAPESKKD
jgi:hypothetical protein